jgi:hypothetical protein
VEHRSALVEQAEKPKDLEIFFKPREGVFSLEKTGVYARNSPRRGPLAPELGEVPTQRACNWFFGGPSTPTIAMKGPLELPAGLFSAGLHPPTEGQRLPTATMRAILPAPLVVSEPLNPILRPHRARVGP